MINQIFADQVGLCELNASCRVLDPWDTASWVFLQKVFVLNTTIGISEGEICGIVRDSQFLEKNNVLPRVGAITLIETPLAYCTTLILLEDRFLWYTYGESKSQLRWLPCLLLLFPLSGIASC